ncbi:MAG: cytochrome c biogenesis protein CcsA [Rubrivivax sp.]|nr:cytochrome c biogenesis protein CcsA [Rubrivivax sp.]
MILPTSGPAAWAGLAPLAGLAMLAYAAAAWPTAQASRWSAVALVLGWGTHLVLLLLDIGGWGQDAPGARLGFAPVLSMTVWLVLAVHTVESRLVPLPAVRRVLALAGAAAVAVAWMFPGEPRPMASPWAPLHFVLGVGSYGLFGAAVLHAALLDSAERRLRLQRGAAPSAFGMPLLQLERLTFRFVEAGFAVLTATLLLGMLTTVRWTWDHKTVFSLLGWAVFAALLAGRRMRGWRGRKATRWLYAGALLLLLAYAGSRFVVEVLLRRGA